MDMNTKIDNPPIIIGASGGSGTRVVAEILIKFGIYLGQDLNKSNDNLLFTYLFKHPAHYGKNLSQNDSRLVELLKLHEKIFLGRFPLKINELKIFIKAGLEHIYISPYYYDMKWVIKRCLKLINSVSARPSIWGWKEPHTGYFLKSIYSCYPNAKYILVLRNGLDMAYSRNDQQLRFWNKCFNLNSKDVTPRNKFEYWYQYNKYILTNGKELFSNNFFIIRHEDLCFRRERVIKEYLNFLGLNCRTIPEEIMNLPKLPKSYNRFLNYDNKWVDRDVRNKLAELGY